MSFDDREEEEKQCQWGCVKVQIVTSIVRDIGDQPCLHQSPMKITKMLKPEKWQATFDSQGKLHRFQKALRLIYLGGVDPSIRAEVWEFLLGCYTPGSTSEYRRKLRTARREKFKDLIKQCQTMHSSVGTGSLAYAVGSKVMDMRTISNDNRTEVAVQSRQDTSSACLRPSTGDSADLVSVRGSTDSAAYDSSCHIPSYGPYNCSSPKSESNAHESQYAMKTFFDFPALPVTNLFERSGEDNTDYEADDKRSAQHKLTYEEEIMHNFQIDNSVDLVTELNDSASFNKTEIINRLRISDVRETPKANMSQVRDVSEERVSEWLWTLHRIAVDVVRTDCHLEFFEDTKNLARMSDILAVYAWVDPATGYCQGMSDLLSPFVVLFEDTADAFWCFEMLLRRMRDNFLVEGPTGVMKQLQALWNILEFTDREMFAHFSHIGAESLHFAFRMLLVLFRRELSFDEALCMWEMMWAADFDEAVAYELVENCLEPLVVQIPRNSSGELGRQTNENDNGSSKRDPQIKDENVEYSNTDNNTEKQSNRPFCGLARDFWSRNDTMHICTVVSSTRNGDDELPVFCVAAILIMNRQKIIRETHSIDDLIKIFNDNVLKINIKRCVRTAIKLRKKYFYKLIKSKNPAARNSDG